MSKRLSPVANVATAMLPFDAPRSGLRVHGEEPAACWEPAGDVVKARMPWCVVHGFSGRRSTSCSFES